MVKLYVGNIFGKFYQNWPRCLEEDVFKIRMLTAHGRTVEGRRSVAITIGHNDIIRTIFVEDQKAILHTNYLRSRLVTVEMSFL